MQLPAQQAWRSGRGFLFALAFLAISTLSYPSIAPAQGPLAPTDPPGFAMRSLEEIHEAADSGRTPITQGDLPLVIDSPGSYFLAENLVVSDPEVTAITVTVDGVSLDFAGHILQGPGSNNWIDEDVSELENGDGVLVTGDCVFVGNGTIIGFGGDGLRMDDGAIIEGMKVINNGDEGIQVDVAAIIIGSVVENNGDDGFSTAWASIVADSVSRNNSGDGTDADGGSIIVNCAMQNNGQAPDDRGAETFLNVILENCVFSENAGDGLLAGVASLVYNCSFYDNTGEGIEAQNGVFMLGNSIYSSGASGIRMAFNCYALKNLCTANGFSGIHADQQFSIMIENTCADNTFGLQIDSGAGNSVANYSSRNTLTDNTNTNEFYTNASEGTGDLANIEF